MQPFLRSPFLVPKHLPVLLVACALGVLPTSVQGATRSSGATGASAASTQPDAGLSTIPVTENSDADLIASINSPSLQLGIKALNDHLPLVAVKHLNTALEKGSDDWIDDQTNLVRSLLGEALIRAGEFDKGTALLEQCPSTPANKYWSAIGLLNQGKYSTALEHLVSIDPASAPDWRPYILQAEALVSVHLHDRPLLENSLRELAKLNAGELSGKASIWLADLCIQANRREEATQLLAPFLTQDEPTDPTTKKLRLYAQLVDSFLKASEGKWDEAKQILDSLSANKKVPTKVQDLARVAGALLEIARENSASISIQENEETLQATADADDTTGLGEDQLLAFIATHANSSLLTDAFLALIKERTFINNADALGKLTKWAKAKDSTRQPLAAYALGTVLETKDDMDTMVELTRNTLKQTPFGKASESLLLRTLYLLLRHSQVEQAEALLKEFPDNTSAARLFEAGRVAFENQDFDKAKELFDSVLKLASDSQFSSALYNANLTALELSDGTALANILQRAESNPDMRERLAFEQAHYAALRLTPESIGILKQTIAESPAGQFTHALQLDLAEVYLNQVPAQIAPAQEILNKLKEESDSLSENEKTRLARLQIILPERQSDFESAIKEARQALKQFSTSPSADRIQLKLGELLFKNNQYNEALLVLQAFEQQYPYSDLNRAATFLAAKAAEQSNTNNTLETALSLFRQLATSPGQYSRVAQLEIAAILNRTGKPEEAIKELDALLLTDLPAHIRLQALSLLADAWAAQAGADPEALTKACNYCSAMLESPNAQKYWRLRALHQRAQYKEKLGDINGALSDYASMMEYIPDPKSANKRDWYWFYTAGFSSLHLAEISQNWSAALAMATKLSKTQGPRVREAADIARRIRLENFIWDDPDAEAPKAQPLPDSSALPPTAQPLPELPANPPTAPSNPAPES